jgi:hypothetical protein
MVAELQRLALQPGGSASACLSAKSLLISSPLGVHIFDSMMGNLLAELSGYQQQPEERQKAVAADLQMQLCLRLPAVLMYWAAHQQDSDLLTASRQSFIAACSV